MGRVFFHWHLIPHARAAYTAFPLAFLGPYPLWHIFTSDILIFDISHIILDEYGFFFCSYFLPNPHLYIFRLLPCPYLFLSIVHLFPAFTYSCLPTLVALYHLLLPLTFWRGSSPLYTIVIYYPLAEAMSIHTAYYICIEYFHTSLRLLFVNLNHQSSWIHT